MSEIVPGHELAETPAEEFLLQMTHSLMLFSEMHKERIKEEGMPVAFFSLSDSKSKGKIDPKLIDMEEYGLPNEFCKKTMHALRLLVNSKKIDKFAYCKMLMNVDPAEGDITYASGEKIEGNPMFNIIVGHLAERDSQKEVMFTSIQEVKDHVMHDDGSVTASTFTEPLRKEIDNPFIGASLSPLNDIFTLPFSVVSEEVSA